MAPAAAACARRAATFLGIAALAAGCTAVSPDAVKAKRDSGVTRRFDRTAPDVYQASVSAIEKIRVDHPYYSGLEVVEKDPATGTVIAEQRLDSAVIPGLGEKDAIGIFVAEAPGGRSDVTVVTLASDQIPGGAGTYVASLNGAEARVFPAIDSALDAIPESEPVAAADAAPQAQAPAPVRSGPAPGAVSRGAAAEAPQQVARTSPSAPTAGAAMAAARGTSLIDRVYDELRAGSSWRPLVREVRDDGSEEVRVGRWATITEAGGRIRLAVRDGGSAADAARLALDLERAGFDVDVAGESASRGAR